MKAHISEKRAARWLVRVDLFQLYFGDDMGQS